MIGLQNVHRLLGLHRLRPGLNYEELSRLAVFGPLYIHGPFLSGLLGVIILNYDRIFGQRQDFLVGYTELPGFLFGHIHIVGQSLLLTRAVDHLDLFVTQGLPDERLETFFKCGLEDIKLIGVHSALHNVLTQTIGPGDEDHIPEA